MRLFERAIRRAGLPVAMSQGFNPRPKMSFPAALSVGVSSRSEVLDFALERWVRPAEVETRLSRELPEGIGLVSLELTAPHPNRAVKDVSYRVPLLEGHPVTEDALQELMERREILAHRRKKDAVKTLDIRPFIKHLRLEDGLLCMLLEFTSRGTARPQEVMEALGCTGGVHYPKSAIERTRVNLSSSL